MLYEYWKSRLNAGEKQFYNEMLQTFSSGGNTVRVRGLDIDQIKNVYTCLKYDHPELYFLTYAPMMGQSGFSQYSLTSKSTYSFLELGKRSKALKSAVADINGKLPFNASDLQKELAVAEYILDRVEYAIDNARNQDASAVFYTGKAQCSGISGAAKYLFDNIGVKCITAAGSTKVSGAIGPHAWNIVYIDGKPYHLDLTSILGGNNKGVKPYRYSYFNLTDNQLAPTHVWDKSSLPQCDKSFTPPETLKSGKSYVIMPTSAAYESGDGAVIITSLYEFRRRFLTELDKPHNEFVFMSKIRCDDDNELMQILTQACRQCFVQKHTSYPIRISISANLVTLSW